MVDSRHPKFQKALLYAKEYELDRDDRIALAENLLWRDVASWKDLDEDELTRLLDCLEGYYLVGSLRLQRTGRTLPPRITQPEVCSPAPREFRIAYVVAPARSDRLNSRSSGVLRPTT